MTTIAIIPLLTPGPSIAITSGSASATKQREETCGLGIARLVYDHQLQIREYLGIDESEALIQFKFVVS